jgi:cytochrome d ubiquinol oxidase subunit I
VSDLLFARWQMALSLAFHIVFASIGIAMPVLMVVAEWKWRRRGDPEQLTLAKAWAKGTAVLFAVGAVSGTVLSFELGLLFPRFMEQAGPVIGLPFALEGFAFFTEAIFLGLYLYGWQRLSPKVHLTAGALVALSGLASAVFVLTANAWMNAPRGFRVEGGRFVDIDPIAAMTTPFAAHEILHMAVAAYSATGFGVAAVHAFMLLRYPARTFHVKALSIALWMAVPTALVQPLIGHFAAQQVAEHQPMKLAAMEGQYRTEAAAPLRLGGLPDHQARVTRYAIEVPGGLSWLATGRSDAMIQGLEAWPEADWPHPVTHVAFQVMVALGVYLAAVAVWALVRAVRKRPLAASRSLLRALVVAGPAGFLAIEAGWVVTEVGRQPWIVQGAMRTADAVTTMPGLVVPFIGFLAIYVGLATTVVILLWRQVRATSARKAS